MLRIGILVSELLQWRARAASSRARLACESGSPPLRSCCGGSKRKNKAAGACEGGSPTTISKDKSEIVTKNGHAAEMLITEKDLESGIQWFPRRVVQRKQRSARRVAFNLPRP